MVAKLIASTNEQKAFYANYLDESMKGEDTKQEEEKEEKAGGIKSIANYGITFITSTSSLKYVLLYIYRMFFIFHLLF